MKKSNLYLEKNKINADKNEETNNIKENNKVKEEEKYKFV